MRLMRAPSLVWLWMCQRKRSPTLMCTRSSASLSNFAWVPLPQPCTPMMMYLCMGDRTSRLREAVHLHRMPPRPGDTARHLVSTEPQAAPAHLPEGFAHGGRDLTGVRLQGEAAGVEDVLRRA